MLCARMRSGICLIRLKVHPVLSRNMPRNGAHGICALNMGDVMVYDVMMSDVMMSDVMML